MKGLLLIYAITGLGSLAALRSPLIGLYIYVGFAVLRPQFIWGWAGDFSGISQIVGIATLIGWIFKGFGSTKLGRGRSIVLCFVAFALWTVASASQAFDKDVAYAELIPMAKFFMPFMIGVTLLDAEDRSRTMLWIIVLAQGYVAYEMNYQYYIKGWNIAGDGFGGMDNNCFGVSLVSTIGPAIALGLGAKKMWERVLAGVSSVLILHTTLLTFSRGAMVGLLAVGAAAFFVMPKRPKYLAVMLVGALIAARLTGPQLAARYVTAVADSEERDGSAESRLDLWADCFRIATEKPIFGIGPGNFPVVAGSRGWTEGKQAHSVWMQTMAENGFPGVLALLAFFGIACVKLWPLARERQTDENRYQIAVATGIIMSIVGFAVAGQFVSLGGLEVPYYTTMVGVVLLKTRLVGKPLAVAAPRLPQGLPGRPMGQVAILQPRSR